MRLQRIAFKPKVFWQASVAVLLVGAALPASAALKLADLPIEKQQKLRDAFLKVDAAEKRLKAAELQAEREDETYRMMAAWRRELIARSEREPELRTAIDELYGKNGRKRDAFNHWANLQCELLLAEEVRTLSQNPRKKAVYFWFLREGLNSATKGWFWGLLSGESEYADKSDRELEVLTAANHWEKIPELKAKVRHAAISLELPQIAIQYVKDVELLWFEGAFVTIYWNHGGPKQLVDARTAVKRARSDLAWVDYRWDLVEDDLRKELHKVDDANTTKN